MDLKFLALSAFITLSFHSFAQTEVQEKELIEIATKSEPVAIKPEEQEKSLDEIEAEASKLAQLAKKFQKKSEELQKKASKMAKKSDKAAEKSQELEEKSEELKDDSENLSDKSQDKIEMVQKLKEMINDSPDKANRDEAIKQLCQKKVASKSIINKAKNLINKKTDEERIESCILAFRDGSLKKKKKLQKVHLGKQCEINLGISIECPEGTYKFIGNDGLANISSQDRSEQKDLVVSQINAKSGKPSKASAK